MKATGIVRRIDDLGRVVVPKEIRRTLRIREGDPLEIFVEREGEVILKKYSPIHELGQFAEEYAKALFDTVQHPVMITDRDEVIAVSGESKKEFTEQEISTDLNDIIQARQPVLHTDKGEFSIIASRAEAVESYCVTPIIANGDPIGCILIFSKDSKVGHTEQQLTAAGASFLAQQME
ncbi:MAG TPA: stage V sporulation protein T [Candidatus Avamphibacillus intestinigallinarum]|nr:stage V sporulation protein T [Candidatus Avamphibacillus intestinigallinarum]